MKKILISGLIALAALAAVLLLRFAVGGPEDEWICSGGQWVRHGNPSAPRPEQDCLPAETAAAAPEEEEGPVIPDKLPLEMNFFEFGSLVRVDSVRKIGPWDFAYERIGAALQTVSLVFDKHSVCTVNGETASCADLSAAAGVRTRVEGYRLEEPYVLVRLLLAPPR